VRAASKAKSRGPPFRNSARCHSDANLIHKFKPQQRWTSSRSIKPAFTASAGRRNTAVANCVDCHSVHDIRDVRHALSPVHPLRLPETCALSADAARMSKYKLEHTQFDDYRHSVHWAALAKRGDLSAPSCASCHGNHGATPPQVASVAAVCGTCHVLFEELYNRARTNRPLPPWAWPGASSAIASTRSKSRHGDAGGRRERLRAVPRAGLSRRPGRGRNGQADHRTG
jgi:hypothetical protein